jgi:hypothetical protein
MSNNRFPNFFMFFFVQEQSFLKLVNFSHREGFYLSFIFFSGSLHHKYLGKNWVAHCFTFLVFLLIYLKYWLDPRSICLTHLL